MLEKSHSTKPAQEPATGFIPTLDQAAIDRSAQTVLRELLLLEYSPTSILTEFEAYRALNVEIIELGIVCASLLKHPADQVREEAFFAMLDRYQEAPEMHTLLYIAAANETNSALAARMFADLDSSMPGKNSTLSTLHSELRFASRYAKEQNMKIFSKDNSVPDKTFSRILISSLDRDSLIRNESASALREVLRNLDNEQRTAALWHVAYGLRELAADESRSSFQGRLLGCASFFRDDGELFLPLVLKLCESPDLLLRVDAACTVLFLNPEKEDHVTNIVVAALAHRMQLHSAPPLDDDMHRKDVGRSAAKAKIEADLEYQWQRFGISHFLEFHHGIKIDMSEEMQEIHIFLDQVQARLSASLDEIVKRFEKDMDTLAQRTSDIFSMYFRTSLVGIAGAPLPLLSDGNQENIVSQLFSIIVQPEEAPEVKIKAMEQIPRATIPLHSAVGPLLKAAIMEAHSDSPQLRAEAYKTLGALSDLPPAAEEMAASGIQFFGLRDPNDSVREAAKKTQIKLGIDITDITTGARSELDVHSS